jgi:hypothetical protein
MNVLNVMTPDDVKRGDLIRAHVCYDKYFKMYTLSVNGEYRDSVYGQVSCDDLLTVISNEKADYSSWKLMTLERGIVYAYKHSLINVEK